MLLNSIEEAELEHYLDNDNWVAEEKFDGVRMPCLLYTSDAADERSSVDLGGRRIIKKKTNHSLTALSTAEP